MGCTGRLPSEDRFPPRSATARVPCGISSGGRTASRTHPSLRPAGLAFAPNRHPKPPPRMRWLRRHGPSRARACQHPANTLGVAGACRRGMAPIGADSGPGQRPCAVVRPGCQGEGRRFESGHPLQETSSSEALYGRPVVVPRASSMAALPIICRSLSLINPMGPGADAKGHAGLDTPTLARIMGTARVHRHRSRERPTPRPDVDRAREPHRRGTPASRSHRHRVQPSAHRRGLHPRRAALTMVRHRTARLVTSDGTPDLVR